jgi:hypothetical protein
LSVMKASFIVVSTSILTQCFDLKS